MCVCHVITPQLIAAVTVPSSWYMRVCRYPAATRSCCRSQQLVYVCLSSPRSYSQLLLLPFGYSDDRPSDYHQLLRVAKLGRQRIFGAAGTWFKIGQPSQRLYPVSGISQDWAKAKAGVKYAFSLELRDRGKHGLLLPASQIEASGKEMADGVTAMIEEIL